MTSSYSLRSISDRTTLSNGTTLSSYYYGPSVIDFTLLTSFFFIYYNYSKFIKTKINSTYPLGSYLQDYYYAGTGDLDEYNGRW